MKRKIMIFLSISMAFIVGSVCYLCNYYHAEESVKAFLVSNETVLVTKIPEGYFFDGPGENNAIIFYPGGKVEETAYAPMLFKMAEEGIDTFLLKMPFRIAFFGESIAEEIIQKNDYQNYYFMGHSLRRCSSIKFCL